MVPVHTQARLIVLAGPLEGREFTIAGEELSIGRDESGTVVVEDRSVSRRHCVIRAEGARFMIRDLGSANGTRVNGLPIEERILESGDEIKVGGSRFVFLVETARALEPGGDEDILAATTTAVLRRDEAVYLRPEQVVESAPWPSRIARNLKAMLQASAAVSTASGLSAIEARLTESLAQAIPADRGAILLVEGGEVVSAHHWERGKSPGRPFHVPGSIVARVLREGVALCLNDVLASGRTPAESLVQAHIQSILAAPLMAGENTLGAIYLDTSGAVRFEEDHLQLLTGIAGLAAAPLANALRLQRLESENRRLEAALRGEDDLVGNSDGMRDVYKLIRKVAPTAATVLIAGESGTGKELVARAIHRNSPRTGKPFAAINCAAITETLLESEFFGHERGAFTGAVAQKRGKLEEAEGGTVFLDEIGELALPLQGKLLRVLQERQFERVGGTRPIKVDIRIIAASNRDLEEMVQSGTFRQDLYFRLNVVSVALPPLRERRLDIPLLANYFLQKHRALGTRQLAGISAEARVCLMNYDWPGNVRELENAIERAIVLGTTEEILPDDLPDAVVEYGAERPPGSASGGARFHETIRDFKRQLVVQALEQAGQNHTEAAKILGLHPNNLHRLMKNLKLKTR